MAIIRYFRKHEAQVFGQQQTGVLRSKKIGSSFILAAILISKQIKEFRKNYENK